MTLIREMKKRERETFDFCSDGIVYFCKWNDNSIANIASNFTSHTPTETVKRRVKKKADACVTQPKLIKQYNLGMGGADVMDQLLGTYRPMIRGKKWYWRLVINAINVSVVAAWRIHCNAVVSPMTHLEFCPEIVICLLKSPMEERTKVTGRTLSQQHYQSLQNHNNPRTVQNLPEKYKVPVSKMQCSITFRQRCSLVLNCIMEIRKQWTFMSHVQEMWLFDI